MRFKAIKTVWAVIGLTLTFNSLIGLAADSLEAEQIYVQKLTDPQPNWLVVNDPNFLGNMDSKVLLMDVDSSQMLGTLSTGAWRNAVEFSPNRDLVYSPETYYSRGTRGERVDVITIYELETLSPLGEIEIPPKRGSGAAHRAYSGISFDGRFVYVFNVTPAMSVSIIDVVDQTFVEEIAIDGCAMVYPTGNFSFLSLCGNGRIRHTKLNQSGNFLESSFSGQIFDPMGDPLTEKAARVGGTWYFVSFHGKVVEVDASDEGVSELRTWNALSKKEVKKGWRPGGGQLLAVHDTGTLYLSLNRKGVDSHKLPGERIRAYSIRDQKKIFDIKPAEPVINLVVSSGENPILVASTQGPIILVHSAKDGSYLKQLRGPLLGTGVIQFLE